MRILHCIPGMGGGGAERQLAYLGEALPRFGWEVHVALRHGGPNLARLTAGGVHVHRLTGATNYDPRIGLQLRRLIKRVQPDLVQVWLLQMEVFGGMVAELCHIPWILSERSSESAYPRHWKHSLRVRLGRTADAIVSNSRAGDDYWSGRAGGGVRRFVVPNAVPSDEIVAGTVRAPLELAGKQVILAAGRFGPEKNVEGLLEALRPLVRRPGAVAVWCGDGPLLAPTRDRVRESGLDDRLLLPGYVEDFWPLLGRADVLVAVGFFEGCPNVVLEAMAAGCPLVLSDIPAHRELLAADEAAWADPSNPSTITSAVQAALADPEAARARARKAQARVQARTPAAIAAAYDRIYRELLDDAATAVA